MLLVEAGALVDDMMVFVVYVRDIADAAFVRRQMRARFRDTPIVVVRAPVCRPGWLVEVEGIAIAPARLPQLPSF